MPTQTNSSNPNTGSLYIHIPFCKKACHYCDFHFSTTLKKKSEMVLALCKELVLRKKEFENIVVETIYFGGGTPSLLEDDELRLILNTVFENYNIDIYPEITLEANPDDLTLDKIKMLSKLCINRLSVGVQSFFDDDLKMMNRAHNSVEAIACIEEASRYFDNISIDLIYGIPEMSAEKWKKNIYIALGLGVPHISAYALTVEPKTALSSFIKKKKVSSPDEDVAHEHFSILVETMENAGFIHYELSNFGKTNFFSRNNSAYWTGKRYIGIGPSAHSYNIKTRSWNVPNNSKYLIAINGGYLPKRKEVLSQTDKYNEYLMTGFRTIWGVSLDKIYTVYGMKYLKYFKRQIKEPIKNGFIYEDQNIYRFTKEGMFIMNGILIDLFME